jgi:hypothetical protein
MEIDPDLRERVRTLDLQVSRLAQELALARLAQPFKPILPDTFDGTSKTSIDAWLYQIEQYQDFDTMTESIRVKFATRLLKGKPLDWWRAYQALVEQGQAGRIERWYEFKEIVQTQFKPFNSVQLARDKLAVVRQTSTVSEYIARFQDITLNLPHVTPDEMRDRFIRGLKYQIRKEVLSRDEVGYIETTQLAARLDLAVNQISGESGWRPSWSTFHNLPRPSDPMELDAIRVRGSLTDEERNNLRQKGCCFYCREFGHVARHCPRKSRTSMGPLKEHDQ